MRCCSEDSHPPDLDESMQGNPTLCRFSRLSPTREEPHLQTIPQTPHHQKSLGLVSPTFRRSLLRLTGSPVPAVVSSVAGRPGAKDLRVDELVGPAACLAQVRLPGCRKAGWAASGRGFLSLLTRVSDTSSPGLCSDTSPQSLCKGTVQPGPSFLETPCPCPCFLVCGTWRSHLLKSAGQFESATRLRTTQLPHAAP